MTPDTTDDAHDAHSSKPKTFRPFHNRDRMNRRVRDDHAPNAALHATLRALAEADGSPIANVNLMASHAPGEKPDAGKPTHYVSVDIENAGAGSAATYGTVIRKLIRYDDVVIRDAEATSIPPESDAHPGDTDYALDRLTLNLRAVETTVEPIEVRYRDLPSDVLEFDTVRRNARMVLDHAIDEEGSNARTYEAARCLATMLAVIAPDTDDRSFDNDAASRKQLDHLLDATDHDFGFEESPDGCVEYVTFPDLDVPCVTYECSNTATASRRYQFPSGYVVDVPVCDDHEDDFDRSLLSHPLQDEDAYHAIDFKGGEADIPHFEDTAVVVDFVRAILDTYDVDHPVEPTGYATGDGDVVACGGEPDAANRTGADRNGAHAALGPLTATGLFGELLAELDTLKHDLRESGDDGLAKRVDELAGRYASRADDTPDRDTITTSGRVDAPPTPDTTTSLAELTAAELGSCVVEGGWSVECPVKTSDACTFRYSDHSLDDYHIGMLVAYPECEACGATLYVVPPGGSE